ncbi:MAG: TSUP family transporter [Solirubrobacterales bacterium]|nr:TSUP family transporter [Solirubrobacterales bacterium]
MDLFTFPLMLAAFGVLVGVASGLIGVGGGIFLVPYLVVLAGLSQHSAQATSLLVVLPTAAVASWSLVRRGVTDVRTPLRIGAVGVAGSVVGTLLALVLPGQALRIIFAVLMCIVGIRLLRDAVRRRAVAEPERGGELDEAPAVAPGPRA